MSDESVYPAIFNLPVPGIPKWKYFGNTQTLRYKITKAGQQRLDWFNRHKDRLMLPETPWEEIEERAKKHFNDLTGVCRFTYKI